MAIEFHNLELECDAASVVPSGPNYTEMQYQTCSSVGSEPGILTVSGDAYLASNYNFSFSHVWRNFGIIMLFVVAYIVISAWLTEVIEWSEGATGAVEYRRKRRNGTRKVKRQDEENKVDDSDHRAPPSSADTALPDVSAVQELQKTESAFTWRSLNYTIKTADGERTLLNDVTGYCQPGELTALVGSSGAGKSTRKWEALRKEWYLDILNVVPVLTILTQRQRTGHVTGDLKVGGALVDDTFRRRIGYCQQMDIHDGTSTIREAFEFSALLRQNADVPRQEKLDYVKTVLDTLDLTELQDAVIASLPLEQKRRTTIGVELCARPSLLLFLDEPTSVSSTLLSTCQ